MTLKTNLEVSPYLDDFREEKDFYRVLFKPGVPVQTRELNQLQTILQKQIERFGDNILQKGTIVDGCQITFHDVFPYVKIKDTNSSGDALNLSALEGFYLKNSSNLQAYVVTTIAGFESKSPDLNTLYLRYLNSGVSTTDTAYAAGQVLTVFKPDYRIYRINVNNGSQAFSNSDSVVIVSALAVQNSVGGTAFANNFYTGDYLSNGKGANVQITSVDTTTNTAVVILNIEPRLVDLQQANTSKWSILADDSVISSNTGGSATVVDLVGEGASAFLRTTSTGKVSNVTIETSGAGYYVDPFISIRTSTANTLQLSNLSLAPQNFLEQVTVAPGLTTPVGAGYGVTVSNGVIYQQGFFQRVSEQLLIVEKYANTPDAKVVGFDTSETIINSNIDESLLDNALGSPNFTAPGADRLKLTPTLVVISKVDADANTDFFSIVEFATGQPYKQNKITQYNVIMQEVARRTYEEAGNFVLDRFNLNTKSTTLFSDEATKFSIIIDPGLAYIRGDRVETLLNYNSNLSKAVNTAISNNATISLDYGSYVKIQEYGGAFDIDTAASVNLYNATSRYVSTNAGTAIAAPSSTNLIGTARVRSLAYDSGTQGTPQGQYRLYLFDIVMNTGAGFGSVRSIYQSTGSKAIADVVLTNNTCVLTDSNLTGVCFPSGITAMKNANNLSYTYKTFNNGLSCNTSGIIQKTLGLNETFRFTGDWSTVSKNSGLVVIPLANVVSISNTAGSVVTLTTTQNVVGTTTSFTTDYNAGDFVRYGNTLVTGIGQISTIANNTFLTLAANASVAITGNLTPFFPADVPINMAPATRTANVSANGSVLSISLGLGTNSANVAVEYDVVSANVQPVSKTVNRDCYVRLNIANNTAGSQGPWCLGISDVFRMKGVFLGPNTTFLETDVGVTDLTTKFYIDHNQNENYCDTSFLYPRAGAVTVSNTDFYLVKLDAFTTVSEGLKTLQSYPVNDTLPLANSAATINTLEIPEFYNRTDDYFDLRDQMDFRPVVAATANVSNNATLASINPVEPISTAKFSGSAKKFPSPGTTLSGMFEYYLPRVDRVLITSNGDFKVLSGIPGKTSAPEQPSDSLTINLLQVAAYPSLPYALSNEMIKIADTKVACGKFTNQRLRRFRIVTPLTPANEAAAQPRGYTMSQIGELESRIADLEYYLTVALSQLASLIKQPTNSDGTLKAQYGYFADSYDNAEGCDIQNPEWAATVLNGRLLPKTEEIAVEVGDDDGDLDDGGLSTPPYSEKVFVSQLVATDGTVQTSNTSSNTVVTVPVIACISGTNRIRTNSTTWLAYEDIEIFTSSTSGPIAFYFSSVRDTIAFEVYQGSVAGFSLAGLTPIYTAQNALALTADDVATRASELAIPIISLTSSGFLGSPSRYVVFGSGKVSWTHTPTSGQYYVIRMFKRTPEFSGRFRYTFHLCFPIDQVVSSNTVTLLPPPTIVKFRGYVIFKNPSLLTIHGSQTFRTILGQTQNMYISDSQRITLQISGLKPYSTHAFLVSGVDVSGYCQQTGQLLGAPLVTDSSGTITFDYYYDAGITEVATPLTENNLFATNATGTKSFAIQTSDGASQAVGTFDVKTYADDSGTGILAS